MSLQDYRSLDRQSPRSLVSSTLTSIANGSFSDPARREIVQLLLQDIDRAGSTSRLDIEDTAPALIAVKTLCRHPAASSLIVAEDSLRILHRCLLHPPRVSIEAQRCIANGLLLHESGRELWITIGGGVDDVQRLKNSRNAEECFVASRILFLITLKPSTFMRTAIQDLSLVDIVANNLDRAWTYFDGASSFGKDALVDLLKLSFNLMVHSGQKEHSNDLKATGPFNSLASEDLWDPRFQSVFEALLRLLYNLPKTSPSPLQSPLTYVLHNLMNVPADGPLGSMWISPYPGVTTREDSPLTRLWELCDRTFEYYVPYDPDDPSVRSQCRSEGVVLDELAVPLPIILARVAKGNADARKWMFRMLLPDSLDRSTPLERRRDLLGRCIRLMSSIHNTNLKDTVGEMVFSICDGDASEMSRQIGYGNAAGFLFSKGITSASGEKATPDGSAINPITGMAMEPGTAPQDEMTEEEREAEAERLFVLFDRLERTGLGVNPVRHAQQEGRLG